MIFYDDYLMIVYEACFLKKIIKGRINKCYQYHFISSFATVDVLAGDFVNCEADVSSRNPEYGTSMSEMEIQAWVYYQNFRF